MQREFKHVIYCLTAFSVDIGLYPDDLMQETHHLITTYVALPVKSADSWG